MTHISIIPILDVFYNEKENTSGNILINYLNYVNDE